MPPGSFSVISGSRPNSVGGGVVADIFRDLLSIFVTFAGHLEVTHRSFFLTTSIYYIKKTFTKSLGGGPWPPWPLPGYATEYITLASWMM